MSKYTLTIRGLESQAEARKIAEDYFGVMMWKHESGCMTCWPQRDEHPLTITDSGADGKVVAGLQAEVRRLRRESTDVFECADGTVAKDATVAAQSWADECRRLREREAKARDFARWTLEWIGHPEYGGSDLIEKAWSRWLETE